MSKRLTTPLTAIAISSGGVAVTRGGKVVPIKVHAGPRRHLRPWRRRQALTANPPATEPRLPLCGPRVPADRAPAPQPPVAAPTDGRKAPPRLRKPSPHNDQCLAPTGDLEITVHDYGEHSATPCPMNLCRSCWASLSRR